jgi:regulator of sigma E protease
MASYDPVALFGFIAALSVNLAVINALPFPALDGGQLVFVLPELLTGKKIPKPVQDAITTVAFGGLFLFGLSTILGDLTR